MTNFMTNFISYPSIKTLNANSERIWHRKKSEKEINNFKYYIEEKIDGSQMSLYIDDGKINFYNKKHKIDNGSNYFAKAISILTYKYDDKKILNSEYIYHGEVVCNLKHNVILYKRTPKNYYIVYDIYDTTKKCYLSPELKQNECIRIGLEYVPILYYNNDPQCSPVNKCRELIDQIEKEKIESCLGGIPEGIVLKHHSFYMNDVIMTIKLKLVATKFKERRDNIKDPKQNKKVYHSPEEFLQKIGSEFCTKARFQKAIQHLAERNEIDLSQFNHSDVSKVITELNDDFDKEYMDEVLALLWTEFGPIIKKYAREGIGIWLKEEYMDNKIQY